ncbi:MAG TPA: Hsp33 family molecular chaperone HslO [Casimicrobiaceae bacterium]|nr:Hsp33 family molecular chaperone HslO [Casimicrobiaceae bacterium]
MPRTPTEASDADALVPFVVDGASVRGSLIRLDATSATILAQHDYPPALARVLAELSAAAALLASTLKLDGSLVVQLSGDGPVRLLVVECTDALDLRATAQWNEARVAAQPHEPSLAMLAGGPAHGRLTITLDQRNSGTLYQGVVALDGTSVAASIEHYLTTSEQLRSRLWLVATGTQVAGLLLQRLPDASDDEARAWPRLVAGIDASIAKAVHAPRFADALRALFPRDDVRMFDPRPVRFACRCSAGRVANALRIAGRDEIEATLAERGIVEVTCEFCNRRYTFGAAEARALFARPADARG